MTLSELTADELLVFVGLARLLINVDDLVSLPELTRVREITEEVGRDAWRRAADEAKIRFQGLDGALEGARQLRREPARSFILEELTRIAAVDEVIPAEAALLARLEEVWA